MSESMRSRGMRDVLPEEMGRIRRVESTFREVCLGWGYEEVRTPTIEHLYLFTAAGALSPQMLERVYSFLDWDGWSGERVVLRPDSTIPSVRLFQESMPDRDSARLFYVQNVFRFEQGEASREDYQCGAEWLGESFPHGDIELIVIAAEVLARLGIEADLRLSHPGIVRGLMSGDDDERIAAIYDALLDGESGPLRDALGRLPNGSAILSVLSTEGNGPAYLDNLAAVLAGGNGPAAAALAELRQVSDVISGLGLAHRINPLGVRDFEYYTGPVFTLSQDDGRIGGGGRYDSLAELVGGQQTQASGFALESERLAALTGGDGGGGASIAVRHETPSDLGAAFALARQLRQAKIDLRVQMGRAPADHEIVVSGVGITLRLKGAEAGRFAEPGEAVAAVAEALGPGA
jgi:histidyl-tRNA synthetase